MAERPESYRDGQPCWADLATADMAMAKPFYAELLGWTYRAVGDLVTCLLDGKPVAALTQSQPEARDAAPSWRVVLACTDVAALTAQAERKGGAVIFPPSATGMPTGRAATLRDPTGAVFGAWQGPPHAGFGVTGVPGSVAWSTLTTTDGPAVDKFYGELFRYEKEEADAALGYAHWSLQGENACGRMVMGPGYPAGVPSHWMPYFGVANAEAAAKAAVTAGGKVQAGPLVTPLGTVVILLDSIGAPCCVVEVSA